MIREEIFGPCCHVRPFDTEEEAIRLANDSPFGLASVIWTENLFGLTAWTPDRGWHHLGQYLEPA